MSVRQFIEDNGIRQVDLARFLGITPGSVSKMAKGITMPSAENMRKMMGNDRGWDTSALTGENRPDGKGDASALREENRRLRREVDRLLSIIERLTDPSLNRHSVNNTRG